MNHMFLMAVLDSRYNLKIWWEKNQYFFHMAANKFAKQFCFPDLDFLKQQNAPYTCSHKLQTPLITSAYK